MPRFVKSIAMPEKKIGAVIGRVRPVADINKIIDITLTELNENFQQADPNIIPSFEDILRLDPPRFIPRQAI